MKNVKLKVQNHSLKFKSFKFSTLIFSFFVFIFIMISSIAFAAIEDNENEASPPILDQKLNLEKSLKKQVEDLLSSILGQSKSTVIVNVEISTETQVIRRKIIVPKPAIKGETSEFLLPGIPLVKPPSDEKEVPHDENYEEVKRLPKISRIMVTIFLDNKVADEIISSLKTTITSNLGLNIKRGDILDVQKAHFANSATDFIQKNKEYLILAAVVISLIAFLFGPVRGFLKNILSTIQDFKGKNVSVEMGGQGGPGGAMMGGATTIAGAPGAVLQGGAGQTAIGSGGTTSESSQEGGGGTIVVDQGGKTRLIKPFSFIKKSHLQNLVYLIQEEPPEIISLIMSYLNPEEAADVMGTLPMELQGKVALAMATVKQASQESVLRAEDSIKRKIDFLIGGIDRFVNIIDRVDKETREEILSALEKESPALADRVRAAVFSFDNLIQLDNQALQILLREIKTDALAKALKNASDEIVQKVKSNISAGAATLLAEEMELSKYLTPQQIEDERKKIVDSVRKLEKEGKIYLKKQRKKAEKIEKLEQLEDKTSEKSFSSSERPVEGGAIPEVKERKVALEDYADSGKGKILSMTNIFKEVGKEQVYTEIEEKPKETLVSSNSQGQTEKTAEKLVGEQKNKASVLDSKKSIECYNAGMKAYQEKQYDNAINEFKKSIENNPNFWQAYQFLGNCYYAKGMLNETVRAYEESVKLNPKNDKLSAWLKAYYSKQGAKAAKG